MPQQLKDLDVDEVSLVDSPANSSPDDNGVKVPRARVALFKRDDSGKEVIHLDYEKLSKEDAKQYEESVFGKADSSHGDTQNGYPKSDFAYTPDDVPSHWKLRLTSTPGGKPDAHIVGAAVAALGKGFRGNKVQIPSSDRPAVIARVRSAWKQANPDKGGEELPEVLKGARMTLEDVVGKVEKLEVTVTDLTKERDFAKAERDLVLKMSKKQRKAYASMSPDQQKAFMSADEEKRKSMCDAAMQKLKEKAAEDCMDEATKAEFEKAGPIQKAAMIAEQLKKMEKGDAEGGSNEDDMDKKKKKEKAGKKKSGADNNDEEDDSDEDDDSSDDDKNLELRKANLETKKLEDRVVKAEKQLEEVRKRDELETFCKMADENIPNLAGTRVEKGTDLMTVAKAAGGTDSDIFKRYLANLTDAEKSMKIHFTEIGKHGVGAIPAERVWNAKVEEISKNEKISVGKATELAMDRHPELYANYEQQHRMALTGR